MKIIVALVFAFLGWNSYANACSTSPYWSNNYQEEITKDLCLSINGAAGAKKAIKIDTTSDKFNDLDRVWLEIYDWDGDNRADWIRLSNYLYANRDKSDGPYSYGAETISFYQGQGELDHMLKNHGFHLEGLKGMSISADEQGTSDYDGSYNGLKFNPIDDELIKNLFSVADAMLVHNVSDSGRFSASFGDQIQTIMSKKVLTYPSSWRQFE